MTVKLIGALFVAVASFVLSSYFCGGLTREKEELEAFINLIRRIRLEISCFSRPLSEIYSECSYPALDRIQFTEILREQGFFKGICVCKSRLSLSDGAREVLLSFGESLGHGYKEDEIKRCDNCISHLEEEYRRCLDALPEKSKLIKSLSITFGISVIIILI